MNIEQRARVIKKKIVHNKTAIINIKSVHIVSATRESAYLLTACISLGLSNNEIIIKYIMCCNLMLSSKHAFLTQ